MSKISRRGLFGLAGLILATPGELLDTMAGPRAAPLLPGVEDFIPPNFSREELIAFDQVLEAFNEQMVVTSRATWRMVEQ